MGGQAARRFVQRAGAASGQRQHLPAPGCIRRCTGRSGRGGRGGSSLLQHHMDIGAANAKGAHARAARRGRLGPGLGQGVDMEGTALEVDLRVRPLEMQARRQGGMPQREHRLDQARDTGGRNEMADIGLHRADGAIAAAPAVAAVGTEGLRERGQLDRVAQRGAGAVRLDIADGVRGHVGHQLRRADRAGLALHARCGDCLLYTSDAADD